MTSLTQLRGVDLMKFLMAFAVIAIHVQGPCDARFPAAMRWLMTLAVPFFFVTSGFLMQRKLSSLADDDSARTAMLRARARRVLRVFGLWLCIYAPVSVAYNLHDAVPLWSILKGIAVGILIRGEITMAWPLWFLYSLAIFTLLLSLMRRSRAGLAALAALCGGSYLAFFARKHGLLPSFVNFLPLRVIGGGIYILSGMMVYKYSRRLVALPSALLLLGVSAALHWLDLPAADVAGGAAMFILALKLNPGLSAHSCMMLRSASMWIYYLHMFFVVGAIALLSWHGEPMPLWPVFAGVSVCALGAALALTLLQQRPRLTWLRTLVK